MRFSELPQRQRQSELYMGLDNIRNEIDSIDDQLIDLFEKRMEAVQKVTEVKIKESLPVIHPGREQHIIDRACQSVKPEFSGYVNTFFRNIFELSKNMQRDIIRSSNKNENEFIKLIQQKSSKVSNPKVIVQGIKGSYSTTAACSMYPDSHITYVESWDEAFSEIENNTADYCVIPVENSAAGSVIEIYDLLLKYKFFIVDAKKIYINHCLLGVRGSNIRKIKQVYTHPHAFPQCKEFFKVNHNLVKVPYANTALAAQLIAKEGNPEKAAIASKECAHLFGLDILAESIQDTTDNCTRFISVSKNLEVYDNANKISISFTLPHITGSLYRTLSRFALSGINITKIESRPSINKNFEYYFYLDFTSSLNSQATVNLLSSLQEELPAFYFLGNYNE